MKDKEYYFPSIYAAIYTDPGQYIEYNGKKILIVKVGSSTDGVTRRVRRLGGQISAGLELSAWCSEKPMTKEQLQRLEEEIRQEIDRRLFDEVEYRFAGKSLRENFSVNYEKVQRFIKVFEEVITDYNFLKNKFYQTVEFDIQRREYIKNIPKFKEYYNDFLIASAFKNRNDRLSFLKRFYNLLNKFSVDITETIINNFSDLRKDTFKYSKKKKKGEKLNDYEERVIIVHRNLNLQLKKERELLKKKEFNLLSKEESLEVEYKSIKRKSNKKFPLSFFGVSVGDYIYFRDNKNKDLIIRCVVYPDDTVVVCDEKIIDSEIYRLASFIDKYADTKTKEARSNQKSRKGGKIAWGWKEFFYIDSNCEKTFERLKNEIIKKNF